MRYNLAHLGNDAWFNYKSDIISSLYASMIRLGLDVSVSHNQLVGDRFNVIIGADWVQNPDILKKIIDCPKGYAIFEIEHLRNDTINQRANFNFKLYEELARSAKFIFSCYSANLDQYSKMGLADRFIAFKWGFVPEIVDLRYSLGAREQYVGTFIGMAKGSRKDLISSIAKRYGGLFRHITVTDPFCMKDFALMRSRWALSIRDEGDETTSVNPFRIFHHISNGIPVLANHGSDPDGYSDFVKAVPTQDLAAALSSPRSMTAPKLLELSQSSSLTDNLRPVFLS